MKLGQFRRDTIDNWIKYNPILVDVEFVLIVSDKIDLNIITNRYLS